MKKVLLFLMSVLFFILIIPNVKAVTPDYIEIKWYWCKEDDEEVIKREKDHFLSYWYSS